MPRLAKDGRKRSFFGLPVVDDKHVRAKDIATLPFYDFWREGYDLPQLDHIEDPAGQLIPIEDRKRFSKHFVATGRHLPSRSPAPTQPMTRLLAQFWQLFRLVAKLGEKTGRNVTNTSQSVDGFRLAC